MTAFTSLISTSSGGASGEALMKRTFSKFEGNGRLSSGKTLTVCAPGNPSSSTVLSVAAVIWVVVCAMIAPGVALAWKANICDADGTRL